MKYTQKDLENRFLELTGVARVRAMFQTELVGGAPADEAGVRAFIQHHLKLEGEEAEGAVRRILSEETGQPAGKDEELELEEHRTYGLSILRCDECGPWIGNWMVKACLKAAASRLGLFVSKRGSKGDVAEIGRVTGAGASGCKLAVDRIHLVDEEGLAAKTYYRQFKGRVSGPTGSVSIVGDRECAPEGTRFGFEFRWKKGKLADDDIANMFAIAQNIGLGSAKAFERGKFSIQELEIN